MLSTVPQGCTLKDGLNRISISNFQLNQMKTFSCGSALRSRFVLRSEQLVGARDGHGFAPLHYAARHGSASVGGYLREGGADVTALDSEGHPALYHAVMMEHVEVSKMLLDKMLTVEADWRKAA
jgi:hypothetical protein